ncbi:hypothetical protein JTB14_018306 [Gonioctena quinquepunctata]|nr:hypothetical protein JTB14_018306 [Gonioctena quinquepunctata]
MLVIFGTIYQVYAVKRGYNTLNLRSSGSYDTYRKILKQENISSVKLGHEECEDCEYFLLHNEDHKKDNLATDCAICQQWNEHITKADKSRTRYK